jgi:hypothetical protein
MGAEEATALTLFAILIWMTLCIKFDSVKDATMVLAVTIPIGLIGLLLIAFIYQFWSAVL